MPKDPFSGCWLPFDCWAKNESVKAKKRLRISIPWVSSEAMLLPTHQKLEWRQWLDLLDNKAQELGTDSGLTKELMHREWSDNWGLAVFKKACTEHFKHAWNKESARVHVAKTTRLTSNTKTSTVHREEGGEFHLTVIGGKKNWDWVCSALYALSIPKEGCKVRTSGAQTRPQQTLLAKKIWSCVRGGTRAQRVESMWTISATRII